MRTTTARRRAEPGDRVSPAHATRGSYRRRARTSAERCAPCEDSRSEDCATSAPRSCRRVLRLALSARAFWGRGAMRTADGTFDPPTHDEVRARSKAEPRGRWFGCAAD